MAENEQSDKPRILLICRDLDGASHLCAELALAGWSAVEAVDPMEAFAAARSLDIDLVLLYLRQGAVADLDLLNVIRKIAPTAYLPVMIISPDCSERQRCECLDAGADDTLSGDVSMMEMVARIRSLLRMKDLHDQLHASRAALRDSLFRERKLLSKLRRDNAHLQVLATTDSLTRLQNVGSFREILAHEFHMARRYDHSLSLLMLDVDHFKLVNDTHGHPSGDYVLKELAVILKRSVRESDVVARTGGEEFGIILPKADRRRAAIFAARIRREVAAKEFAVYGHIIHVTASVGVATFPADAETTEPGMLLYFADQALLEAKETGRDRVVPFSGMDPSVRYRLRRQYAAMHSEKPEPALDDALETRR